MTLPKAWGYELRIDAYNCKPEKVTDAAYIRKFTKHLVDLIDMVAMGEPQIDYCMTRDPEKRGYTLYQLIETSNIIAHFLDYGDAYVNIFSCKPFDPEVALASFNLWFEPTEMQQDFKVRGKVV